MIGFVFESGAIREWLVSLAALLVALAVIWRYLAAPMIRWAHRIERVITSVEEQLYPNHGSSLRDQVTAIQSALGIEPHLPPTNPPEQRRHDT